MRQDLPVRFIRINEASKEASESICPENKDGTLFCDDGISHGTPVQPQSERDKRHFDREAVAGNGGGCERTS